MAKRDTLQPTGQADTETVVAEAPPATETKQNDIFSLDEQGNGQEQPAPTTQQEQPAGPVDDGVQKVIPLVSEKKEQNVFEEYAPRGIASAITAPQRKERKYKVFRLVNTKRNGKVQIHGEDDIVNPKTGLVERARCLRGVPSIWSSEQKNLTPEYIANNIRQFIFEDRTFRVDEADKTAVEFLTLCKYNIENPSGRTGAKHEFFEWSPKKQEEERLRKQDLRIKAILAAKEVPEERMMKHALYLGISFSDEVGERKTPAGIRHDYIVKADEDPKTFMDSLGSQEVDVSYFLKAAIRDARIDLGRLPNTAHWSDGGFIARIPTNRNATDYLIELALTNTEEGRNFKQRLLMLMNK